jgi:hypothetical protein
MAAVAAPVKARPRMSTDAILGKGMILMVYLIGQLTAPA